MQGNKGIASKETNWKQTEEAWNNAKQQGNHFHGKGSKSIVSIETKWKAGR
jgi:hypothetical protein